MPDGKPVTIEDVRKLSLPPRESHKGQNGRLLVIGGSHLFHAASLWALTVASRIVDLVHYSSVPENNELVAKVKEEFRNGIVVPRGDIDSYIKEDDCVLIGPGMVRDEETKTLTDMLLTRYPQKRWVIDAGALQMMDTRLIPKGAVLTPHQGEYSTLLEHDGEGSVPGDADALLDSVSGFARKHRCIVLLKGVTDIACSESECRIIEGGNAGMTKGGTGDVLAGLIAALACKNDPYLATIAGSFINKQAGDELFRDVGPYFNSTDLANRIPRTMARILIQNPV